MICPNCQKEVPDTARACGYCGYWLAGEKFAPSHPEVDSAVLVSETGPNPPWIWIGLGAMVVVTIVGLIIFMIGQGHQPTRLPTASSGATVDVEATIAAAIAATEQAKANLTKLTKASTETSKPAPTDTPTQKPTNTPTFTSTPQPLTATPKSTSTPRPLTATPTSTNTPQPTPAPPPSTESPLSIQPSPAPIPIQLSPTPVMGNFALVVPELLAPSAEETVSRDRLTDFRWKWIGQLPANMTFEIRIWQEGVDQVHYGAYDVRDMYSKIEYKEDGIYQISFVLESAYTIQLRPTETLYQWTVAIVQIDPYQPIGLEASPRQLIVGLISGGSDKSGTQPTHPSGPPPCHGPQC